MATCFSILAWESPWTEERGRIKLSEKKKDGKWSQ